MKTNKKLFIIASALILISGLVFIRPKVPSAASDSYYETLKIASSSLNGNSIWGAGESFDTVVAAGGLDDWAAFYSSANKSDGGLDSSGSLSVNGIPYDFNWSGANAYDGNDTIKLYTGNASATMNLETIGAYEQIYVLGTAGGPGEGNYANFSVVLNYTDGTSDATNYKLYDWYDATPVSGVYKYPNVARRLVVKSNTSGWNHSSSTNGYNYEGSVSSAPYLQSATINVNPKKLLKSIDFKMTGKNGSSDTTGLFCGIYAVTGMVNIAAPDPVENIYVSNMTQTTAQINWDAVSGATTYRLDISTDPNFLNILENYNNREVDGTELLAEGLDTDTVYYTRVRAENVNGQSISSDVAMFKTLPEADPPELEIDARPGLIQIEDLIKITATDESGVAGIEESSDSGETWGKISDNEYAEYLATENITYCFRAYDTLGNYSDKECVTYERLDNQKPGIKVNTNGYEPGSWTNETVVLTVEDTTVNVGETKYYYSEDGETWLEYVDGVIHSSETSTSGKVYYFKAVSEAGVESDVVEALVRKDNTAPSGEISSSENSWNRFLNTITFGLFFNQTTDFEIETSDALSGVEKVEYLITEEKFESKSEAEAATGWMEVSDAPVSLNPDGDFILYYKITDVAGNVNIINTEGIVLDSVAALIEGYVETGETYELEPDKTYYLTQKIIVTDNKALDKIFVNDEEVELAETNIIELAGNAENVYRIKAVDKAGNVSELTINTGRIEDLTLDLDKEHVNSDDLEALKEVIETLEELEATEGENETETEKEIIEEIINEYEELIEKVETIVEDLGDIEDEVNQIPSVENITKEDKETIEELLERVEAAEDEYEKNLTNDEANQLIEEEEELREKLARIEEIEREEEEERQRQEEEERQRQEEEERQRQEEEARREREEHVKEFEDKVRDEFPELGETEETDKDAIEEGIELYENLTDEEKAMVDPEIKEKYDEILEEFYHTPPTLEIVADTENWKASDFAEIIAADASGIEGIYISTDNGETWEKITNYDSVVYEAVENGIYKIKAVDKTNNETTETVIYGNLDPVKPELELNSNGYELGTWTNKNVTLSVRNVANNLSPVEIFVSTDGETWENYSESIIHSEDTEASGVTYYFKAKSAAGLESEIVEGNVKKDTVAPTGTIELGDNGWHTFLNTITFGLFFNETKEFRLIPDEDISGIAKVEYLVLEEDFNEPREALGSKDWLEAETTFSVEPERDFVVYFRITDGAGNVNIINSEGVVLDVTPATIEGLASGRTYELEENKVYYLTQKILVSDNKGIKSITVNGESVEGNIIDLPGNVDAENKIVVTDKAGNVTELTVKTAEFRFPSELDLEQSTEDDVEEIETLVEKIETILEDPDSTPSDAELEILNDLLDELTEALNEIETVEEKVGAVETDSSELPENDNLTSDNKETIESLIEEIEDILNNDQNHLTDEEKEDLSELLEDLNEKLDIITAIEEELEKIETEVDGYDIDKVTSEDKEDLEEIKEEIENLLNNDQNHLTDEEKETLEEEKNKVEELLERIEEAKEAIEEVKENNPVETITKDNVTKEDQTTLEDAQAGYVEALGVFDGNFSLSELFNINNAISIINSALDVLDQVAEFEAMIARLPNPEDVDYSARTDIKAAQLAYNELSDYAKTLVGPSLMSKYKAVLSAYKAFLSGSPLLTAFETLDVFWWAISTFFIVGVFIIIAKRTHKRYSDIENDDDF
ncbi:Ig-like domain repeat protein [Candidatus Saccharibacteria bacterium]|nr:Ig-like domain repeat protein [Candidatus Saccharibacteria bacterium]